MLNKEFCDRMEDFDFIWFVNISFKIFFKTTLYSTLVFYMMSYPSKQKMDKILVALIQFKFAHIIDIFLFTNLILQNF